MSYDADPYVEHFQLYDRECWKTNDWKYISIKMNDFTIIQQVNGDLKTNRVKHVFAPLLRTHKIAILKGSLAVATPV